jgi:hypothetical protein
MAVDVRPGRVSAGARRSPRARYLPIAEHGLIGDLHTVALVGTDGTIDWYCCPRFDSPSVFAAILDHRPRGPVPHRHLVGLDAVEHEGRRLAGPELRRDAAESMRP